MKSIALHCIKFYDNVIDYLIITPKYYDWFTVDVQSIVFLMEYFGENSTQKNSTQK